MAIRIRESSIKAWSSQSQRQFGIDLPLKLEITSAAEETFLAMLELGIADGQLETAAKLAGLKIEAAQALLAKLAPITEDFKPPIATAEARKLPSNQRKHFSRRQASTVFVPKLDRFGKLLVHSLAHSGVGQIITNDSSLVSQLDCGRLGYSIDEIGETKISVLRAEIANAPSHLKLDNRMKWLDYSAVDIAVVETSGAFQPSDYQRWLSLGRNHLGVCFSDSHVLVTGIVRENLPCLGCRELNKWESDESRKILGAQIAGITGLKDSSSILFATAVSGQKIVNWIDSQVSDQDVEYWSDGNLRSKTERINPQCFCQQGPSEI